MPGKQNPPHVHSDLLVDSKRIDDFADAPRDMRLSALAELRGRVSEDSISIELGLAGGILGAVASAAIPVLTAIPKGGELWVEFVIRGVGGFAIGFLVVAFIAPLVWPAMKQSHQKKVAEVWLRAYEEELTTRWARNDRSAKRWQKEQTR